jgi:hypothetical protein
VRIDRRQVAPPRRVDVLRDDRWRPALLTSWLRYDDTGWRGICHWTDDQHLKYDLWVRAEKIRRC